MQEEFGRSEATTKKGKGVSQKELLVKIDLTGLWDWSQDDEKEAWEHIAEYAKIFARNYMDLGKTSLVKHCIRSGDKTPYKEHYQQNPPSMYEEVWEHLKAMLEIVAIWPSHSPWASPVILVCKKDGKLKFCIKLRKLNACTSKDPNSLPRVEDTLDNLNGAVWFSTLDLKSGY